MRGTSFVGGKVGVFGGASYAEHRACIFIQPSDRAQYGRAQVAESTRNKVRIQAPGCQQVRLPGAHTHRLRPLLVPLHGAPLALAVVFALGFLLALQAGLLGLPLFLILFSWVWKYAFILLEATARGLPAPVLSIEMVNPWDERRPLGHLLLVGLGVALVWFLRREFGSVVASVTSVLLLVLLPAATAVLAIERSWLRALSPPTLLQLVRALGGWYPALVAWSVAAVALSAYALASGAGFFAILAAQLLMFSTFTLIGGAVHERRLELGFEAWQSPERTAENDDKATAVARERVSEELYTLIRTQQLDKAFAVSRQWLAQQHHAPESYAWLRDRAADWDDRRMADALTRDLVTRLLALGRHGNALLEVERWWKRRGSYVPGTVRELVRLHELARKLGHDASAERLRAEGMPRFAGDPELAPLNR